MSDIFISYASADRERARLLADALANRGYSVWWDRTIPPGRVFDEVIQEAIQGARCMVVLWSADSARSNWVKTEAAEGVARGILVPALVSEVAPPIEFKRIQSANLSLWNGDETDGEYRNLLASIEALIKKDARASDGMASPLMTPRPATDVTTSRLGTIKTFGRVQFSPWPQWLHFGFMGKPGRSALLNRPFPVLPLQRKRARIPSQRLAPPYQVLCVRAGG